jgi:hypothetical protein
MWMRWKHTTILTMQKKWQHNTAIISTIILEAINMAWISKEKTAEIRAKLKAEFPEIKFSVRRETGSLYAALRVVILKAPYELLPSDETFADMTYRHRDWQDSEQGKRGKQVLDRIRDICNEGNYNNSRPEVDYFDVGWYCSINVGSWDKPFELVK